MNRQLFRVALLCFLLTAALSVGASAAIVDSGTCGDNATWTLDDAGKLTIRGTGEIWMGGHVNSSDVKTAQIENGITSIANSAFEYYDNLTSVTIPKSLFSILPRGLRCGMI